MQCSIDNQQINLNSRIQAPEASHVYAMRTYCCSCQEDTKQWQMHFKNLSVLKVAPQGFLLGGYTFLI